MAENNQGNEYKVMACRYDEPERMWTSFRAENDDEARGHFEQYKNEPSLAWDRVRLVRVDRPVVNELVTELDVHREFESSD